MARRSEVRPSAGARGGAAIVFVLLLLCGSATAGLDPDHEANLTVFGRIAPRIATGVELRIDGFRVTTADGAVDVAPGRTSWTTAGDAGTPRELMRAALPAGRVDSLHVRLDEARVRIGGIWTAVDLRDVPIGFAVRRDLAPGECLVLHLSFDPDATAVDADPWRPVLDLRVPERPPLGQRIFVALADAGTLAVLDRRSGEVVEEIGVGGRPTDLVYSQVERRLFVTVAGRDELVAIDLGDVDRLRRLPLRFGDEPTRLILSDDERDVFVLARGHDALVRVSNQTFQESDRIPVEARPVALATDPRTGRVFVSSETTREIQVIDPRERTTVERFVVRDVPGEMVFLNTSRELLVGARDARSIERIDAGSGATIDALELCGPVRGMVAQRRSGRVFAVLSICDELSVLRPRLDLEIATQRLPGRPGRAWLDPEERMLLVPIPDDGVLLELNTSRTREVLVREVGPRPVAVSVP